MGQRPSFFNRTFIIKRRLQLKLIFIVVTCMVATLIILGLVGNGTIFYMVKEGLVTDDIVIDRLEHLNRMLFFSGLGLAFLGFLMALVFSNHVAGPIYRFERTFNEIQKGDISMQVRIRQHDELQDTAASFNKALESLRTRIRKERVGWEKAQSQIEALSEKFKGEGRKRESQVLNKLSAHLKRATSHVKIDAPKR